MAYSDELFFDKEPDRYVGELFKSAKEWWESQRNRVQDQWDMYVGRDKYIQARKSAGYSALSVPLIYVVSEARTAMLWEMLTASEPFVRFEPVNRNGFFDRIRAEHLESAFETIRRDLEWDEKYLDLFQATDIFDYCWVSLELESLMLTPDSGVVMDREMIGTDKMYPGWSVLAPGQVLMDGFYSREEQIPAKFKTAFMPYHELKQRWPDKVGPWIKRYAKPRDDSSFYNPSAEEEKGKSSSSVYTRWRGGSGGDSSNSGFFVVEAHLRAMFSDGNARAVVYTFLPDIVQGETANKTYKWGMPLSVMPKPYRTVRDMLFMARGRSLPFTSRGMGTADLLLPFQREFSDTLSAERDLDRMYLAPPMAVRSELLIGKENPSLNASEIWNFQDKDWSRQMALRDLAAPIITPTPNRGYLQNTQSKMQNLVDLIGAAMEAQTGESPDTNRTATEFSGRTRGAARRITWVFAQHARTVQRVVRSMVAMMLETPDQFLQPPIITRSEVLGEQDTLTEEDLQGAVRVIVPALSEYGNREMAKVMWRMTMEGLLQIPVVQQNPQIGLLLVEDTIRYQGVQEQRVQEYMAAASAGLQETLMMQALAAQAPELGAGGGGAPGPTNEIPSGGSMGPGRAANLGNLQPGIVA